LPPKPLFLWVMRAGLSVVATSLRANISVHNMILYISAIVCPIFSLGLLWLFVPAARKQRSVLARALVLTIGLSLAIAIVVGKTPPSMVHWFIIPRYPLVTVGAFGVWLLCSLIAAILAAAFVMARRPQQKHHPSAFLPGYATKRSLVREDGPKGA
jgi:hypothetical protein